GAPPGAAVRPEREPVPPAHEPAPVHRRRAERSPEVRARPRADVQRAVLATPRHELVTGNDPSERSTGAYLAARGEHVPAAGRAVQRATQGRPDDPRLRVGPRRLLIGPAWPVQHPQRVHLTQARAPG